MSIRLLIADNDEVVRAGVARLLAGADIKIVGEAANPVDAVKLAIKHKPDVILLEARMKDADGLEALKKIRARVPRARVVIFSTHSNPVYIARAHSLGATDYVLKNCSKDVLISAITTATKEDGPIRAGEMRKLAFVINSAASQAHEQLPITPRELQVLRHIAEGLSNKEIARAMEISIETVKEHVQNVLRKLGLTDRTQAAVLAVRMGIA